MLLMKKKLLLIVLSIVICLVTAFVYLFISTPKGDTIASRENILNTAISKGGKWTIAKELKLDGYIISGAYSTDDMDIICYENPEKEYSIHVVYYDDAGNRFE